MNNISFLKATNSDNVHKLMLRLVQSSWPCCLIITGFPNLAPPTKVLIGLES